MEIPKHILNDIEKTGYNVVSIKQHKNDIYILQLKENINIAWDAKDFNRFDWVIQNHESNNNKKEFKLKITFKSQS